MESCVAPHGPHMSQSSENRVGDHSVPRTPWDKLISVRENFPELQSTQENKSIAVSSLSSAQNYSLWGKKRDWRPLQRVHSEVPKGKSLQIV